MFKVPNGQDPYSAIGKYIRDHITVIEDIIAVIKINEVETNQLFMVDTNEENYFIWETDWWEGEEDVTLIDFFPVSEAQRANQSVQSADTISRRDAIETIFNEPLCESGMKERTAIAVVLAIYEKIKSLPSAQPVDKDIDVPIKDCISRQSAIAEIARWIGYIDEDMINRIQIGLNRLPSAQPEPCDDAVSRKAVYEAMVEKGQHSRRYKLGEIWELNGDEIREALDTVPSAQPETHDKRTKTHLCDCISRQDAIDAFYKYPNIYWTTLDVLTKIDALPPAQPEGWLEQNKDKILQAGMEGREIDFRIGGRLFAIREKAQ